MPFEGTEGSRNSREGRNRGCSRLPAAGTPPRGWAEGADRAALRRLTSRRGGGPGPAPGAASSPEWGGGRPRPLARGAAATPRAKAALPRRENSLLRCRRRLDGPEEGDGLGGGRAPQAPRRCPGPAAPDRRPAAAPSPPQGPRREPPPGTEPRPGALVPSRPGCPPSAPHGRRFCSWGNRPPRDQVPPGAKTRTQEFGAVGATGGGREWRRGAGPADRLLGP